VDRVLAFGGDREKEGGGASTTAALDEMWRPPPGMPSVHSQTDRQTGQTESRIDIGPDSRRAHLSLRLEMLSAAIQRFYIGVCLLHRAPAALPFLQQDARMLTWVGKRAAGGGGRGGIRK